MEQSLVTGKQKVLSAVAHLAYLSGCAVGFVIIPFLIYLYFRDTDEFVAYNARQAYIMQLFMFVMMLPFFLVVLAAWDDPESFGVGMGVAAGILFISHRRGYPRLQSWEERRANTG